MKNYESPLVEIAGGNIEPEQPQAIIPMVDFNILAEWVYVWVVYKITAPPPPVNYLEA